MTLYNPAWIVAAGVYLGIASGVLPQIANVLIGIDGTVNAVIDIRKWAPQVKDYIHANTPAHRVLLEKKPANIKTGKRVKQHKILASDH